MQRVFISNIKIQEGEQDIVFCPSDHIGKKLKVADFSGNTVFIIDAHCLFTKKDRQLKQQDQGGVIIYRHLLKIFGSHQDKLKVIFYSAIPKDDLIRLKPENYVLKLLPFVECRYQEGQFENALSDEINKGCWIQFNNASENLLSGWAIAEKQTVQTHFLSTEGNESPKKRTIAIIDDQINEWEITFKNVFEPESDLRFLDYDKKKGTLNTFEETKIEKLDEIKDADLVLSDFYLDESHESDNWMSIAELVKKSGFQLFETIKGKKDKKGISKGVPYIMHTSSNKVQYYKFLDANGVDNWLIKDTRHDTVPNQKKENYLTFKREIEIYTSLESSELYSTMRGFLDSIEAMKSWTVPISWWDSATQKPIIINLLLDSWMALRGYINKEEYFSYNIGSADRQFTPTAICNNLGKILEIEAYDFGNTFHLNYFYHYLTQIRNASSHYTDYSYFTVDDCLIYFDLWLFALKDYKGAVSKNQKVPNKIFVVPNKLPYEYMIQDYDGKKKTTFKHRLLLVYLQYFNSSSSGNHTLSKAKIRKRIKELFQIANKPKLIDEILNHKLPVFKSEVKDYSTNTILFNAGDKIPWAIPLKNSIVKKLSVASSNSLYLDEITDPEKIFVTNA